MGYKVKLWNICLLFCTQHGQQSHQAMFKCFWKRRIFFKLIYWNENALILCINNWTLVIVLVWRWVLLYILQMQLVLHNAVLHSDMCRFIFKLHSQDHTFITNQNYKTFVGICWRARFGKTRHRRRKYDFGKIHGFGRIWGIFNDAERDANRGHQTRLIRSPWRTYRF